MNGLNTLIVNLGSSNIRPLSKSSNKAKSTSTVSPPSGRFILSKPTLFTLIFISKPVFGVISTKSDPTFSISSNSTLWP